MRTEPCEDLSELVKSCRPGVQAREILQRSENFKGHVNLLYSTATLLSLSEELMIFSIRVVFTFNFYLLPLINNAGFNSVLTIL